jgi:hypothetical protein
VKLAALIALALTICLATVAVAAAKTLIFNGAHGGGFDSTPSKLRYSTDQSGTGQFLKLRHLRWNGWGTGKARAHGKLRACTAHGTGCFVSPAEVKAKRLVESNGDGFYTKVTIDFGQNRIKFPLPTPVR